MEANVLEIKGLVKDYPGVRAVNEVSFEIKRNVVHCLVGENGAGKSTLIKILTGACERTCGEILLNGAEYCARNPKDAREKGISTLYQELNVVDQLTVEENLTLGLEDTFCGFLRKTDKVKKIIAVLKDLEPNINPKERVGRLSVAKKQIIEIAKAVAAETEIIIMDEPTAALSESEINRLFTIIKRLREKGVTVIYISHRLDEIFTLGDYVTVMRDGKHVATKPISEVQDRSELVQLMIGRTVIESYIPKETQAEEPLLELRNVCNHKLRDISLTVNRGEIVGFYGLIGAGKTELARAIYGADDYSGEILLHGEKLGGTPEKAIRAGIALVPEERRTQGLFTLLTIKHNISAMNLKKISNLGLINTTRERNAAKSYIGQLNIKTDSMDKETSKLSGGNQQKVVFSKCLFANADLLILDEPTRGIDVGAKAEIYSIVRELVAKGKTIMFFSSELPEILNSCDRIFLLYEGEIKAELRNGNDINSQDIIHIVTGGAAS
ncbi:MAG: sugar ABC transporter ATP-binding protein [Eubacteriales bacterium]|nr:sugar ABC transporter ATP-binding protein [Eubacteriales bacterium]